MRSGFNDIFLPLNGQHKVLPQNGISLTISELQRTKPEILFISSYPPRECGIATYSQDLIKALNNKFNHSFTITVCPLESENEKHIYTDACLPDRQEIKYILNIDEPDTFILLAKKINDDANIRVVMIQHEFGLFKNKED